MKAICLTVGLCLLPLPALAACQEGPFEAFFADFARDPALQKAVTPDQLTLSQMDHDAEPEPVPVVRMVARAALDYPLVPNLTEFEGAGGSARYEAVSGGQSVTLSGDSGYLMTLVFTADPCWRLTMIKDDSM